jgi:hypothetical protein
MFISCAGTDKGESYESNQYSIKNQESWRRHLNVSNTFGEVYEEEWRNMKNGRHILREVTNFEEYFHGLKNIKGNEAKELEKTMWSPYEGQRQQKAELDIEIDEMWKMMMKKSRWRYHGMRRKINHKLQSTERDYINKVKIKQESKIWDPGKPQTKMR